MSNSMIIGFSDAELRRFEAQMMRFTTKKTTELKNAVRKSGMQMVVNARSKAPKSTGTPVLKNSIRDIYGKDGLSVRVGTDVKYAPYMEFGTKSKAKIPTELMSYASQFKGGTGTFEDLLGSIELWAKRKGLPKEAVYPIALKIAKLGVAPHPFLYPAFKEEREKFIKRIKDIMNHV